MLCSCETPHSPSPQAKLAPPHASAPKAATPQSASRSAPTPPLQSQQILSIRKRDDGKTESSAPPVQLIGLDEAGAQALLGAPEVFEDRPPGKTWRFRRQGCVLSLALYPEVETRIFRVLSYEVTSDDHDAGTKQLCGGKFGDFAATE